MDSIKKNKNKNKKQKLKIRKNIKCPYCGANAIFSEHSNIVYKRDYGPIYYCSNYPSCDAFVGCHKGTAAPLGRLANQTLRGKKKEAHKYFDIIWKSKKELTGNKQARTLGYKWLSEQLNIPFKETHIGMFDEDTCDDVVSLCRPYALNIWRKKYNK